MHHARLIRNLAETGRPIQKNQRTRRYDQPVNRRVDQIEAWTTTVVIDLDEDDKLII
jgi:hypothetical protein